MNLFEITFLIFSFFGLLMSGFFFIKKKGDNVANKLLGIYLLLFSYNIISNCFYWSELMYTKTYIHLFYTVYFPWISYGPLFYLYIRRVIKGKPIAYINILHFIPFLLLLIGRWPLYLLNASDKLSAVTDGSWSGFGYTPRYMSWIIVVQLFIYGITSVLLFKKNSALLNTNKKIWLKVFIGSFFGYWIAFAAYFVLLYFDLITTQNDYFIGYIIVFFIGLVTYFGVMQPDVFDGLPMQKVLPFIKYQKTGLPHSKSLELKEQLALFMVNEKPYLENDLKLIGLAKHLNLPRHHMSQVINEHFQLSFFDYINQYRINDAKTLLLQKNKDLNINQIAYSVGFNNRVSFYKAFKKFEQCAPTDFISTHS